MKSMITFLMLIITGQLVSIDTGLSNMPQKWVEQLRVEDGYYLRSAELSPDGKLLATGSKKSRDCDAKIIKVDTGEVLHTIKHNNNSWVVSLAFSPDGSLLATGSLDDGSASVRTIKVATGEVLHTIEHDKFLSSVIFSPDGALLATLSDNGSYSGPRNGKLKLIKVSTGEVLHTFKLRNEFHSMAFSPNGGLLAAGTSDGNAMIINVETGKVLYTIEHPHAVKVAFSSDGSTFNSIGL